jgi:hypothetical protein
MPPELSKLDATGHDRKERRRMTTSHHRDLLPPAARTALAGAGL